MNSMSRRTSRAQIAIRKAWQREQEYVLQGKGTRDWTPEQQKDIIEKGKAYDEAGNAYEGHHMKSAEAYPDYQEDPDNIQFLDRKEHQDAHEGSFRNETNGYLDFFGLGFVMGWSDSSGSHFEGIFEEGETYTYTIMINGLQPYYVGKNTVVTINGKPANCKKIYHDVEESDGYRYEEDYGFYSVTYSLAPSTYTVKFETGEGSKVELQEIESGKTATKPATDPTRAGYTFGGWYADEDRKTEYDFSKAILEDTTIYAKWSAEEKKPSYTILDGANQTLETGAGNDLAVRANGEVSKLIALNVDRKEVDKSNYIITEGSTIATIKAAFLDTLNEGEHTLTFVYTDGEVSTRFTIKKQATPTTVPSTPAEVTTPSTTEAAKKATATSPKTGDSLLVVPLGALMVISLIGILAMKKNKVK